MSSLSETEKRSLQVVKEYMTIAYSPKDCKGEESVSHLVAPESIFISPATFPDVHTVGQYASGHAVIMKSVNDLHIIKFSFEAVQNNKVALRYVAEGSHAGEPYQPTTPGLPQVKPTGRHARWCAAALFELNEQGKITTFIKEWDKTNMWSQLGWPLEDCLPPKDIQDRLLKETSTLEDQKKTNT